MGEGVAEGIFFVVLWRGVKFDFLGMKEGVKKTAKTANKKTKIKTGHKIYFSRIVLYFTMRQQILSMALIFIVGVLIGALGMLILRQESNIALQAAERQGYWFVLLRKSNIEHLYRGVPGDKNRSTLIKTFIVKTGIPGERPTPLPQLMGKEYWLVTKKYVTDDPETAPYFIELNISKGEVEPFGPMPYEECSGPTSSAGRQCNWQIPGPFGLHGVNADISRLSIENPGSSGCIRHKDEDIIYLYNLLDPKEEIRYYVEDI